MPRELTRASVVEKVIYSYRQSFSGRHSERPAEIPNVRPRFRTSGRDSESPAEIPNVEGLECWKSSPLYHFLCVFWNSYAETVSGATVQTSANHAQESQDDVKSQDANLGQLGRSWDKTEANNGKVGAKMHQVGAKWCL